MMILAVKLVFSAATLSFLVGLSVRHSNNALHRKLMLLGFALTLMIAVVLLIGVHGFHSTYGPSQWLVDMTGGPAGAQQVLIAHRLVATVTLLVVIGQVVTGWKRHPLHHRLFKAAIPLWLVTYGSGLVVFV